MEKYLYALLGCMASINASASEITDTTISRIMADQTYGQVVYVQLAGSPARGSGHCHTNPKWDYLLSTETDLGKQLFSQLLLAHGAGKTVEIHGRDACLNNPGVENMTRIEVY